MKIGCEIHFGMSFRSIICQLETRRRCSESVVMHCRSKSLPVPTPIHRTTLVSLTDCADIRDSLAYWKLLLFWLIWDCLTKNWWDEQIDKDYGGTLEANTRRYITVGKKRQNPLPSRMNFIHYRRWKERVWRVILYIHSCLKSLFSLLSLFYYRPSHYSRRRIRFSSFLCTCQAAFSW